MQFDVCCVFVHSHSTRAQRNILMMFKIYVHTRSSISRVYKQHIFDTCYCCCFHSIRACLCTAFTLVFSLSVENVFFLSLSHLVFAIVSMEVNLLNLLTFKFRYRRWRGQFNWDGNSDSRCHTFLNQYEILTWDHLNTLYELCVRQCCCWSKPNTCNFSPRNFARFPQIFCPIICSILLVHFI